MLIVEFDEDILKHYCLINMPELNEELKAESIQHAVCYFEGKECPLCARFKNSIKQALLKEAHRRLGGTKWNQHTEKELG